MINAKVQKDKTQQKHDEKLINKAFPDFTQKKVSKAVKLLDDYNNAYLAALIDLCYYYALVTSQTLVNIINERKIAPMWVNCTEAIFDRGINQLWQFFDTQAKNHRDIINRWRDIFGANKLPSISTEQQRQLARYRNNYTAHYGNDFGSDASNIVADLPLQILDKIRAFRYHFDGEIFRLENELYSKVYLYDFVGSVVEQVSLTLQLSPIQPAQITKEVESYLNSILLLD